MSFRALGLDDRIFKAIQEAGYTEPTPIQSAAIPEILAGHDLIGIAQTGTGKTAAFTLPILAKLAGAGGSGPRGTKCLVGAPSSAVSQYTSLDHRRLALLGDTDPRDVRCRQPRLCQCRTRRLDLRFPSFIPIVLDPPGPRETCRNSCCATAWVEPSLLMTMAHELVVP